MLKMKEKLSRSERKQGNALDEQAMHQVWYRRICDYINGGSMNPWSALEKVKAEVVFDIKGVEPGRRAQLETAWKNFLAKIPKQN